MKRRIIIFPSISFTHPPPHATPTPYLYRRPRDASFDREEDDERGGDRQSCAFLTLETLLRTPSGVTSPITVTFFVAKSMLNDVTPAFPN